MMTNDEMMIVLKAGSEGKDIEFSHHKENNWHLKTSEWDFYTLKYRVKPVEPEVIEQFKYQREKRKEYVVAEDELEGFVDKRVGENIDLVVEKIISRLQPNYEDISRKLQGIEDDYKSLRKTYDSLMDAHTRLLQKYLEER